MAYILISVWRTCPESQLCLVNLYFSTLTCTPSATVGSSTSCCLLTVEQQTGSKPLLHFTDVCFRHYWRGYYPLNYYRPLCYPAEPLLKIQLMTLKRLNASLNLIKKNENNIWAFVNIGFTRLILVYYIQGSYCWRGISLSLLHVLILIIKKNSW